MPHGFYLLMTSQKKYAQEMRFDQFEAFLKFSDHPITSIEFESKIQNN